MSRGHGGSHEQLAPDPFALRLPVFAAPMFLISGPELVLAACKAGIIGAFPTPNARPISELDAWMRQITEGLARARDTQGAATDRPLVCQPGHAFVQHAAGRKTWNWSPATSRRSS